MNSAPRILLGRGRKVSSHVVPRVSFVSCSQQGHSTTLPPNLATPQGILQNHPGSLSPTLEKRKDSEVAFLQLLLEQQNGNLSHPPAFAPARPHLAPSRLVKHHTGRKKKKSNPISLDVTAGASHLSRQGQREVSTCRATKVCPPAPANRPESSSHCSSTLPFATLPLTPPASMAR